MLRKVRLFNHYGIKRKVERNRKKHGTCICQLRDENMIEANGHTETANAWRETGKAFGQAGKSFGKAAEGTVDKACGEEEKDK